jgi:aryl-alcohol dehydrogenase-like predicted oxidoreductase
MCTAILGRTGLEITRVGLGAWAIGGDWAWGWGAQDDADSIRTIHAALERGVSWIDTAPVYGLGRSELVVARALRELPGGKRPLVFTKCGLPWREGERDAYADLSPDSVRAEVDASLRRLGVDVIDLMQIHWPRPDDQIEAAWETLAALREAGKLRHIGVSNFSVAQLERAEAIAPVETLQPPYSLLSRGIEADVLPWCERHDVGILAYSPMASGILSGAMTRERIASLPPEDWRSRNRNYQEPALTQNLALVERLEGVARARKVSAGHVAVAWTLRKPAVHAAIVGMRRPGQEVLVDAADLVLTDAELTAIEPDPP